MASNASLPSYLLTDLSWVEVEAQLSRERRLIVPIGCCDQFGPHLPIGSATRIVEALAEQLSAEFQILRAPAVPYGVNLPAPRLFAGAASVGEKTLHRTINDLVGGWEDCGFNEFILLTAHGYDPHVEALANVSVAATSRVRVVEVLSLDLSAFAQGKAFPAHAGEVITSLMMHLAPGCVHRDRIEDFYPYGTGKSAPYRLGSLPDDSNGVLGFPSLASAEAGEGIFEYVLERLRARVFAQSSQSE